MIDMGWWILLGQLQELLRNDSHYTTTFNGDINEKERFHAHHIFVALNGMYDVCMLLLQASKI
jgi:hypothetical protein